MSYITSAHVIYVSQSEFETALGFGWLFSFQYVQIGTSNVGFILYGQFKVRLKTVPAVIL